MKLSVSVCRIGLAATAGAVGGMALLGHISGLVVLQRWWNDWEAVMAPNTAIAIQLLALAVILGEFKEQKSP